MWFRCFVYSCRVLNVFVYYLKVFLKQIGRLFTGSPNPRGAPRFLSTIVFADEAARCRAWETSLATIRSRVRMLFSRAMPGQWTHLHAKTRPGSPFITVGLSTCTLHACVRACPLLRPSRPIPLSFNRQLFVWPH